MKTEHEEQREFVQWFRQKFPEIRIFAIPNGGHRHKATAMKLKVEGVCRGVPDLFVPELLLWIEMKRETGGKTSADQKNWIKYLKKIGHKCVIGNGFEDAKDKIMHII
jgi:hypothetical protein